MGVEGEREMLLDLKMDGGSGGERNAISFRMDGGSK